MPWWLRILDIGFFVVQFTILLVTIGVVNPVGITGTLGFCILYVLFLYITMTLLYNLLPKRYQKYFKDRSPDNPEGTRDIVQFFSDIYNSIRTKLK